ncbi:MAG: hypothetical protein AAFQ88_05645 [Pseudomonadota bacterium]
MKSVMMAALAALIALPAVAEDGKGPWSEGSAAKPWGLRGEQLAKFDAKVVDAVCHLTGDCPDDCGAGERQMVMIREADGKSVLAFKNIQPIFTGATVDLAQYCGQTVTVDGLLVGDPEVTGGAEIMQIQTVSVAGAEPAKTNAWTKDWDAKFPEAAGKGPWFRRDPRINERIATTGYFGLGKEVDEAYIAENF